MEGANWRADFEAKARAERRKLLSQSERSDRVWALIAAALGALMLRSALHPDSTLQYRLGVLQAAALEFAVAVAFVFSFVKTRRILK